MRLSELEFYSAVGDPPRRDGMPSYSYRRVIGLGLLDSNCRWFERTGDRVVALPRSPWLNIVRGR